MAFQNGHAKRGGRQKGSHNKVGGAVKRALLAAGEFVGEGAQYKKGRVIPGENGLMGFFCQMAVEYPVAFMQLLGKTLPLEVSGPDGAPIATITDDMTLRDAARHYAQMLHDSGAAMSTEEQHELEGVIEDGEVRLLKGPDKNKN